MSTLLNDFAALSPSNAKVGDETLTRGYACSGATGYTSTMQTLCNQLGTGWSYVPDKDVYSEDYYPNNRCVVSAWRGTCKLDSANADPTQCCITGVSGSSFKACPTAYVDNRYSSTECRDKWQNICKGNQFLNETICGTYNYPTLPGFNTPILPQETGCKPNPCLQYAKINPTDPYVVSELAPYCSKNLHNNMCQEFCLINPGACDSGANTFCSIEANKKLPFCGCINSPASEFQNVNPVCVDVNCKNNASYRTAAMNQITTCTTVNCNIIQQLSAGGNFKFTDNVIKQNCGTQTPTETKPTQTPIPTPVQIPVQIIKTTIFETPLFWIILFICIIVIVVILFAMTRTKKIYLRNRRR